MSPEDFTAPNERQNQDVYAYMHLQQSASTSSLKKPLLFQAIFTNLQKYEWQAMGIYDDDDLINTALLLLICPTLPHFVWIGSAFQSEDKLGPVLDAAAETSQKDISMWICSSVNPGSLMSNKSIAAQLPLSPPSLIIERSSDESEDFWTAFNEGF